MELVKVTTKDTIEKVRKDSPVEGAWVDFYTDLTGEDQSALLSSDDEDEKAGAILIEAMIADWNFADADGKKLEISVKGIEQLSSKMQRWIEKQVEDIFGSWKDKKKE